MINKETENFVKYLKENVKISGTIEVEIDGAYSKFELTSVDGIVNLLHLLMAAKQPSTIEEKPSKPHYPYPATYDNYDINE